MELFFYGQEYFDRFEQIREEMRHHPEINSDFSRYDFTREEMMEEWVTKFNKVAAIDRKKYFDDSSTEDFSKWMFMQPGSNPFSLNKGMFMTSIELLGSEE
jgi:hypothetical protein